jgi:hypothetical protein
MVHRFYQSSQIGDKVIIMHAHHGRTGFSIPRYIGVTRNDQANPTRCQGLINRDEPVIYSAGNIRMPVVGG